MSSSRVSAAARTRSACSPASSTTRTCGSSASRPAGAASLGSGRAGVLHGARSAVLADDDGQILDAHSISAGLDYPGVGPEHAALRDSGRVEYVSATDEEALAAFRRLAETEGIIPALEPAHALARAAELEGDLVLVCLSGRGDKDLDQALDASDRVSPGSRLQGHRAAPTLGRGHPYPLVLDDAGARTVPVSCHSATP